MGILTWFPFSNDVFIVFFKGKILEEHKKYSFFVRVWYDDNTYAIFKSPGVVVYSSPPSITSLNGRAVKEVLNGQTKDLDFFQRDRQFNADWTGKFLNHKGSLSHFHVYISTSRGGMCFSVVFWFIPKYFEGKHVFLTKFHFRQFLPK